VTFSSILFDRPDAASVLDPHQASELFGDLNLDQVFSAVRAGRDEYELEPLFRSLLNDVESIRYRHDALRDLESEGLAKVVRAFGTAMRTVRGRLGRGADLHHRHQKARWILEAVAIYGDAVSALADGLAAQKPRSAAFVGLRDYVVAYRRSEPFTALLAEAAEVTSGLDSVRYNVRIKGNRVTVSGYAGEADYGAEVERTFEKFAQGEVRDREFAFREEPAMDRVEMTVLEMVADIYSETFRALDRFVEVHADYLDPVLARFDREVQFYLAYIELIDSIRSPELPFCYPTVTLAKEILARDAFDLALARKLRREHGTTVLNDLRLSGKERILVVTGPNQGGKTTFARTFGQLHYLARLGLPVPGTEARLCLFDRLFTHFERQEGTESLTGKLEDDLIRIQLIFAEATEHSLIILNESFSATTAEDGLLLGRLVLGKLVALDALAVYVTFLHELATDGPATVSMVSSVHPADPGRRTFHFLRKPPEGLAYALAIAEKYALTYKDVKRRVVA
jgi:DNA mismatch repair protein MutS